MKRLLIIVLFSITNCYFLETVSKNKPISIDLFRQESPKKQYIKHHNILRKYGFKYDSAGLLKDPRTNDSINLFRYMDNEFYGKIVIGHPGQTMNVAFDTSWNLAWVMSKDCIPATSPGCMGHNLYDHTKSTYYKENRTKYEGQEGKYTFKGYYSYENVSIAHSNVTDFAFVEMTQVPDSLATNKADGVFGLGLPSNGHEPFLYTLYRQKKINKLLFSIFLNRDTQSNRGGSITLGFFNKKHIHMTQFRNGTIVYDPITYTGILPGQYWKFPVTSIQLFTDRFNILKFCENGCKAIADTSSSQIIGPTSVVEKIHNKINAYPFNNQMVVDCDKVNKLPKFDVYIGGAQFRLKGSNYILKEKNNTSPHVLCVSAFIPGDDYLDQDTWVLGGAFLSQYYSIYNIEDKTIGLVRAA